MVKEVKQYAGYLPDHNEISVSSMEVVGNQSVLTLNTVWKAPFHFKINQTGYANPNGGSSRDYAIAGNNITYLDITFCYATVFEGTVSIPANHPLFKSAQIIKNESDYTLRLHLRKAGAFYGWKAYYNEQDQLCFQFLNPAKVSAADNKYGANLTGVTVMIDVGHGGVDGGAVGKNEEGQKWDEAECNLNLAYALKAELESIGATVVMNRYGDDRIDVNSRQKGLLDESPDICIAIHQNANDSKKVRGFDSYYFTPWSQLLAKKVYEYTKSSGVYTKTALKWAANYFMTRQAVCPSVLTENGFMSNQEDLKNMVDPEIIKTKAEAMTHGIADYFIAINN
jgi:N-acetylmuramoyl-L-alanine amidase